MPHAGGLSEQPALYMTIMSIMASALDDEREHEQEKKEKRDAMIERSKRMQDGTDISNVSGGKGYRYMTDPAKGIT